MAFTGVKDARVPLLEEQLCVVEVEVQDSKKLAEGRPDLVSTKLDTIIQLLNSQRTPNQKAPVNGDVAEGVQLTLNPPVLVPRKEAVESFNVIQMQLDEICLRLSILQHSNQQRSADSDAAKEVHSTRNPKAFAMAMQESERKARDSHDLISTQISEREEAPMIDVVQHSRPNLEVSVTQSDSEEKSASVETHGRDSLLGTSEILLNKVELPLFEEVDNYTKLVRMANPVYAISTEDRTTLCVVSMMANRATLLCKVETPILEETVAKSRFSLDARFFEPARYTVAGKWELIYVFGEVLNWFSWEIRRIPFHEWLAFKSILWLRCGQQIVTLLTYFWNALSKIMDQAPRRVIFGMHPRRLSFPAWGQAVFAPRGS